MKKKTRIRDKELVFNGPILIVVPATLLQNWEREAGVWGCFEVLLLSGSEEKRDSVLQRAQQCEVEIVIVSYEMLVKLETRGMWLHCLLPCIDVSRQIL